MYKLQIRKEAIEQKQEAFAWYGSQRINFGNELLSGVGACLQKIAQHPQHYSRLNDRYRRIQTKGFPRLLIFEIEAQSKIVYIISLFHTSKNPKREYRSEE